MKHSGKRILCFLCVLAVILPMLASSGFQAYAAEGLDLSKMQIVLPVDHTEVEKTAASELWKYLFNMTGVSPAIVSEGENSSAGIYIGATKYAEEKGIVYPTEGDTNGEAWTIQAVGEDLFLCGAPARGPLYAVYHLLEDVLGVRWWNLWEEYVPTGGAFVPADYADSGVPVMEYREIFVGAETSSDYAFFARNRLNGTHANIPAAYGGEEAYGYPAHVHTFNRFFPETFDKSNSWLSFISDGGDFTTNPEWYSMDENGNRIPDGQLCLTNEGLRAEFAKRLVKTVEYTYKQADEAGIESPEYFAVVPNDYQKYCQCAECQHIITTYGDSDYVLEFVNEMARAVKNAGYTDALVEMLVYWNYVKPPVKEVPEDNVQIRFADNYTDLLHGLDHQNNAESMANLQAWIDISKNNVYYWQYVVIYLNNGILPTMFHYGDDITKLQEMGVNGWFAEQEQCINADFWDMKLWLLAKLMENPVSGEEYEALMDEFIYGYYGEEPGKYIRQYLYYMHEKAEVADTHVTFGTSIIDVRWLTVEDIIAGYNFFEQAVAAAGNDITLLRRLRSARCGLDRVIYENYNTWKQQATQKGLTLPFFRREVGERIYQTMTEQIELRGRYDPDYPKFYGSYSRRFGAEELELPSVFDGVEKEHVFTYTSADFRLAYDYQEVIDKASVTGSAVRCQAKTRLAAGSNALILSEGRSISISAYDPTGTGPSSDYFIGYITAQDIKANAGYQLYSFKWTVPSMGEGAYIYMVGDWGVQNSFLASDLQEMVGKTVEIYISMKVTGTVDGSDPSDYPVYYIDRIMVLPAEDQRQHNWQSSPIVTQSDACRFMCTICGAGKMNLHYWDDGVVTAEPTAEAAGEKTYTCNVCGATKTEEVTLEDQGNLPQPQPQEQEDYTSLLIVAGVVLNLAMLTLLAVAIKKRKEKTAE